MGCIALILVVIAGMAVSWALTVGIVYLITLCFGLAFSFKLATGVWLVLTLIGSFFTQTVNVKK